MITPSLGFIPELNAGWGSVRVQEVNAQPSFLGRFVEDCAGTSEHVPNTDRHSPRCDHFNQ